LAPDGSAFLYSPDPAEDAQARYVVEVTHAAYGRAPRHRLLAPRAFGAIPEVKLAGERLEWSSPPWANLSTVRATLADGKVLFDRAAQSPLELGELAPGATVRVRVARVDVQHAGDVTLAAGEAIVKVPGSPPTPPKK
jgi:hypothetical protein